MVTSLQKTYCELCLTNYWQDTDDPTILLPICNCEQIYENIMHKLEQIEQ